MIPSIFTVLSVVNISLFYPLVEKKYSKCLSTNITNGLKIVEGKVVDILSKIPRFDENKVKFL